MSSQKVRNLIIAAYGVVQRLVLIGCYVIMGFMQGYQPVAAYAFGARDRQRFRDSVSFSTKTTLALSVLVALLYILLASPLIMMFNRNPAVVAYGSRLLVSQVILYPAFGLCYMMTITFQTIGASRYGLFLSAVRQGIFYVAAVLVLPGLLGVKGIYLAQPLADTLTLAVCLFSYKPMKHIATENMEHSRETPGGEVCHI